MPADFLVERVCSDVAERLGYELVDLEFRLESQGLVLRVYIDCPAGVTLRDCERVSRDLGVALDVEDVVARSYRLEVSSPGLNRPLRREEHFRRFSGSRVRIRTREPLSGRRNFSGTLVGVGDGRVRLMIETGIVEIPLVEIQKANVEYDFASGAKR
jgi:ribosome maturation factor RimP